MPVEFEVTGDCVWQMKCGKDKWQDVAVTWAEPLFKALRDGEKELHLCEREWPEDLGYEQLTWYTIDLSDHTWITAKKQGDKKQREMRVVQLKKPTAAQEQTARELDVGQHAPPPPGLPADLAGAADTTMAT